ncbi:hypothetical protein IW261DRAFT_1569790 [Armillaria novae-zelandiae]|uniref:Uncharacterized protein n=1 Tax=Armillaria novae-zelandiae TaxID=153914 RepID=A0AA39NWY4_9AGAR|nr:hypothetical protein IW261DRAFT_1569790 [Armillaria novae-zelandiae]
MSPVRQASRLRLHHEEVWGDPENPTVGLGKRTATEGGMTSFTVFKLSSTNLNELFTPLYSSFGTSELYSMFLEEDPAAAQAMLDHRNAWPADDCAQLNLVYKGREGPHRKRKLDSELQNTRPAWSARLVSEECAFL